MAKFPDITNFDTQTTLQGASQLRASNDVESVEHARHRETTRKYVERVDRYLARPDMPRRTESLD